MKAKTSTEVTVRMTAKEAYLIAKILDTLDSSNPETWAERLHWNPEFDIDWRIAGEFAATIERALDCT